MVRSMTGYGRGTASDGNMTVTVELKSVNHRFFECSIKAPRQFSFFEDKLKSYLQSRIARGKVDVFVSFERGAVSTETVTVNEALAESVVNAMRSIAEKYNVSDDVSATAVAAVSGVLTVTSGQLDEEATGNIILSAASDAVDAFIAARETEGARLAADVISKSENILQFVEIVEKRSPETVALYRERLENRIKELLQSASVDEQRVLTETALFADKIAVDEETVRLRSHIAHLNEMFKAAGPIGKKLDFIVQEMNRETNTIGSKCQDIDISRVVVDMKSEIEKIREQIQNIE
ncbi:MAG: YicC/YloC family endoribonuclease [Acutalibacteraceae bacterium]